MEVDQLYHSNNSQQDNHAVFNAKDILYKYLNYAWLFLLFIGLSLTAAWIYLRYTKPLYSVSSTLLIRNDNPKGGGSMASQDMFSDLALFQSNTNKQNEILILSSRTMMERVVKSLGLQKKYAVAGNVKTTDVYPEQPFELEIISLKDSARSFSLNIHFNADWKTFRIGENKKEWHTEQVLDIPEGQFKVVLQESDYSPLSFRDFIVQWLPLEAAATSYSSKLEVKPANDLSNVLSLSYIHENPKISADILNELVRQYNDAAIEDKNEINRKILAFINDRVGLVESQLDSVEGNLERFRTQRQVIDLPAQSQMYFGSMTELSENLRQQEVLLKVAEILEEYITQPANRLSLVPSTLGLTDPTLLELTTSYNRLVSERLSELQTGATVNNPIVKNLEKGIEEARLKMIRNLHNIKQVYKNTINALKSQSGSIQKNISSIPERERKSREKARQQEIKQNLYLYLMQKKEESEIAQASTIASSRIIDKAIPVFKKISPMPVRIYGIALLAGLLIPIVVVYILDLLNDKVTTKADITRITAAPVLGEIGHSKEESVLLFAEHSRSTVAEQFRILRSNLRFVLSGKATTPVILVTSSFSGEGKSFISTNLGATLAISGKRTVILEFDLRKPKILVGLGLPQGKGLTNYLVGDAQMEELIHQVRQVDGLFVIPCGPVPPNPSEILLSAKIAELFDWLKQKFDTIVIDTAPIGLVSDAFTLSQYADASIYVVRQRYTFKRQISFIDELYKQKKIPQLGILVNDVISEGAKGYYGYGAGRYGYGYAMSRGYYDVPPKNFFYKLKSRLTRKG
ncbi:MAG: polysaccharide biosynthesis tyrosine autokinase [Chitinophagaceae bacterium]|nr:polysaccharide biosynthesis tyrosine autokinase [Chitinophagaceae bacterium]